MAATSLFTAASMLCRLAHTLPLMVACRMLQGLSGGVLITVPQAILRESFPPDEQGVASPGPRRPVVDLSILRNVRFSAATIMGGVMAMLVAMPIAGRLYNLTGPV